MTWLIQAPPPHEGRASLRGTAAAARRSMCWADRVRDGYRQATTLDAALRIALELSARTIVLDVEPLVAAWDDGQETLERGVARVVARAAEVPGVQVVCFATNSARRPSEIPRSPGARVVYRASAAKPLRTAPYRAFPLPAVVIGDQIATDGLLAMRLGYSFVHFTPDIEHIPPGPRLLNRAGRMLRPLLFRRTVS